MRFRAQLELNWDAFDCRIRCGKGQTRDQALPANVPVSFFAFGEHGRPVTARAGCRVVPNWAIGIVRLVQSEGSRSRWSLLPPTHQASHRGASGSVEQGAGFVCVCQCRLCSLDRMLGFEPSCCNLRNDGMPIEGMRSPNDSARLPTPARDRRISGRASAVRAVKYVTLKRRSCFWSLSIQPM